MVARLLLRAAGIVLVAASLALAALFALRPAQPHSLLMRLRIGLDMSALLYDPYARRELALVPVEIGAPSLLWSQDGRWVVYRDKAGAIAAYNLATGRGEIITSNQPETVVPVGWSPNGRWLLLREITRSDLLYVGFDHAAADSPHRIDTGIYDVQWSPDSTQLYVHDALKVVSVIDATCLETGAACVRTLVPTSRLVEQLAGWMPGGHELMIVSLSETTHRPQIYSLNPDDGTTRLIVADPLPGSAPVWTPDGQQMAAPLLTPADADDSSGEGIAAVYLIDPPTEAQTLIWAGIAGNLSWTSDGNLLAFDLISRVDNSRSVWLYDRAANKTYTLTPPQSFESLPIWSVYHGRALTLVGLLALDAAVLVALWLTRRRVTRSP